MSDGLLRARFTFGDESEVRYVAAHPVPGDHVSHGNELWLVTSADVDDFGLYVVCEQLAKSEPESELV